MTNMNHATVATKVTQTFHTKGSIWLHQEAWSSFHLDYLQKNRGFDTPLLQREYHRNLLHNPKSTSRVRDAVITIGRWILTEHFNKVDIEPTIAATEKILGLANLQWQSTNFQSGFLDFQLLDESDQTDAVLFFIAAIFLRISPDCLYVTGCDSVFNSLDFPRRNIYIPNREPKSNSHRYIKQNRIEIDSVQWKSFLEKNQPSIATDLAWIAKQQKREEDLRTLKKSKPSTHWLTAFLKGLSGRNRPKNNPKAKTVHPIDRYKKPFIEWT